MKTPPFKALQAFHADQRGSSTIQIVMILAIAAIVGVALYLFGERLVQFSGDTIEGNE